MTRPDRAAAMRDIRRLARNLESRNPVVRQAAEVELAANGLCAVELWAKHVRAEQPWRPALRRDAPRISTQLVVAACVFAFGASGFVSYPVLAAAVTVYSCSIVWSGRAMLTDTSAHAVIMRLDHPRVLGPLLVLLGRLIRSLPRLDVEACGKALSLFSALPDDEAARLVANHRATIGLLLKRACAESNRPDGAPAVQQALGLVALVRRTAGTGLLPALDRLASARTIEERHRPVHDAAAECAQYLRGIAEQRQRNALLLRPADAPTDLLLRPASAPKDDTALLLRPAEPEEKQ